MLIDGKTPINVDNTLYPFVGIAAEVGKHDSGMHKHNRAQLLFAPHGCMTITLDGSHCVLPPTKAAWIPAGVKHCAVMRNVVAYRSLYFAPSAIDNLPSELAIFNVTPLLKELIERMAFWEWDKPSNEQTNTLALCCEELLHAERYDLTLPLPTDKRLTAWLNKITTKAILPQPLNEMSIQIGASSKTISRLFIKETGMPYQAWRQQWRLLTAIEHLAENKSVSEVAHSLEFSSDSAFIHFFKQHTGETPARFM
ncbi:helix-turn-helix domain-containing protein [Aliivibrio sp. EL58]|uniref:AraC family transcriptional regulator n=1 Tax=Aliivibrio sp. EL58 TaxID=2107582 RepID=UPI000EFBBECD|nr:helix-turn-helix transcriptional regulator [Aliivibrio sp. EL58]